VVHNCAAVIWFVPGLDDNFRLGWGRREGGELKDKSRFFHCISALFTSVEFYSHSLSSIDPLIHWLLWMCSTVQTVHHGLLNRVGRSKVYLHSTAVQPAATSLKFQWVWTWPVESLQSHYILTMSHWSSGLPISFPSWGTRVQIPRGVLIWNRDCPVSVVLLRWWPWRDSDHWLRCLSVGASLGSALTMCKPAASSPFDGCFTRLRANNV
jgi:hypothetical protein